jgi:hypothetical protein
MNLKKFGYPCNRFSPHNESKKVTPVIGFHLTMNLKTFGYPVIGFHLTMNLKRLGTPVIGFHLTMNLKTFGYPCNRFSPHDESKKAWEHL